LIGYVALAWLWLPRAGRRRIPLLALPVALVLLVAGSRLYLQVPFPSDLLFGMVASALWLTGFTAWMLPMRE